MKNFRTWLQTLDKRILRIPLRTRQIAAGVVGIALIALIATLITEKVIHRIPHTLAITSSAFKDGAAIPAKYTCDGENLNPPFAFGGLPKGAKSLALLIEDQTMSTHPVHWVTWNIPVANLIIMEGIRPAGTVSRSFAGNFGYSGPCPPAGETHTYTIHAYALNVATLTINSTATIADFQKSVKAVLLDEATLTTHYQRVKK